ncbi:NapC/NirT family cytochrome c [bacterium]|nr:NapC/NirT family cytochrome c [bacterium]
MRDRYLTFIRGMSVNWWSKIGVIVTTSSFFTFIILELFRLAGVLTNAYVGLITYLSLPVLFILGLLLIPFGWFRYTRSSDISFSQLLKIRFDTDDLREHETGSHLVQTIALLTLINIVFLGVLSTQMLHFMDEAHFCGTACHSVMNPEWTTYQQSPHSRVKCVECHVGEGVDALIDSKLNGMWQMISVTFDLYECPIPTPVRNLRPARETCEKCHWPEKFHGNRIVEKVNYKFDKENSPQYTTLVMKIGSGGEGFVAGSHWHVSNKNRIKYTSVDDEREEIIWVEVLQSDSSFKKYYNKKLSLSNDEKSDEIRVLDCVDCHNRATHIYQDPEQAIDEIIQRGLIDRSLPYIKQRTLGALLNNYPDLDTGLKEIDNYIWNYYNKEFPNLISEKGDEITNAVEEVKTIYSRNIHHRMNITWNSYPSHLGHKDNRGCFRCHNSNLRDDEDNSISMDCTLCHSFLALDEDRAFKYLDNVSDNTTGDMIHKYFKDEFGKVKDF